jgi:RimJ/RimL family protein N-acetyltransferase
MSAPGDTDGVPFLMETRRVIANVPGPNDLAEVFDWTNDPKVSFRWRMRGAQMTPTQFQDSLANQAAHFVGKHRSSGRLVAYANLFAVDLRSQHAQLGLLANPRYTMSGLALELGVCVMQFAFSVYPLRKVYWELPAYNRRLLIQPLEQFAALEAELPEHTFWNGQLHSTLVYSISRQVWEGSASDRWRPLVASPGDSAYASGR